MCGGISMITHRHAVANNPLLTDYDPAQPNSYIMYLDANNLYGWAMSEPLPVSELEWITEEQIKHFQVEDVPGDAPVGYILEVDLEYPSNLHKQHNDYPLAPEAVKISSDMLSPYSKQLVKELQMKPGGGVEKLVTNLQDKQKYILHYHNLKLYLQLGMKLKKIHRVLKFQQCPWLKPYIDLNTAKWT